MTYLRVTIGLTLLFILAVLTVMVVTFDTQHELNLVQEAFLKGEFQEAHARLERVSSEVPSDQLALYRAYLLRQEGNLKDSSAQIQQALQAWSRGGPSRLGLEITINQALNAYLQENPEQLQASIKQLKELPLRSQEWEELFNGIQAIQDNHCQEALQQWRSLKEMPAYSPWMQRGVVAYFPTSWRELQKANCLVHTNDFTAAKSLLEGLRQQSLTQEESDRVDLLLGKAELLEAETKPIYARQAYFKTAFATLSKVPLQAPRFKKDREEILNHIDHTLEALIASNQLQEMPIYVAALQQWRAQTSLEKLTQKLIQQFDAALARHDADSIRRTSITLNRLLPDGDLRQHLSGQLQSRLLAAIQSGNSWQTSLLLDSLISLEGNSEGFKGQISNQLRKEIMTLIPSDSPLLIQTTPYFTFWEQLSLSDGKHQEMAQTLLQAAKNQWQQGYEPKALRLVRLAVRATPNKDEASIQADLEAFFHNLYRDSLQHKSITALPYLQQAIRDFDLRSLTFNNPADIALLQEEASYLAANGRQEEAELFTQWIDEIAPENNQNKLLSALLAYKKGDYQKSESILSQLSPLPKEAIEPLTVSQLINTPHRRYLWEEFTKRELPTPEAYLHLALAALKNHQAYEATAWLKQGNTQLPEAQLLFFVAYAQQNKWQEAWSTYQQLPSNYQQLSNLSSLVEKMQSRLDLQQLPRSPIEQGPKLPAYFDRSLHEIEGI